MATGRPHLELSSSCRRCQASCSGSAAIGPVPDSQALGEVLKHSAWYSDWRGSCRTARGRLAPTQLAAPRDARQQRAPSGAVTPASRCCSPAAPRSPNDRPAQRRAVEARSGAASRAARGSTSARARSAAIKASRLANRLAQSPAQVRAASLPCPEASGCVESYS